MPYYDKEDIPWEQAFLVEHNNGREKLYAQAEMPEGFVSLVFSSCCHNLDAPPAVTLRKPHWKRATDNREEVYNAGWNDGFDMGQLSATPMEKKKQETFIGWLLRKVGL